MTGTADRPGGDEGYAEIAEFYDHVPVYRDRPDVDFYVRLAREAPGPVLELGCGTGRVLVPVAQAGYQITGLDLSAQMLAICAKKLARESREVQAQVELIRGDMRDFRLGREFALISIPFRAFQHLLTVEDQLACLGSVHRHLRSGGLLVLDLFNPSLPALTDEQRLKGWGDEPEFTLPDGRRVVRRFRIARRDWNAQVQDVEMLYLVTHADGRQEQHVDAFPMRYLFRFEAEHLLARCGYQVEEVWGGYDRAPFGQTYPGELICLARKAERPGAAGYS